MTKSHSVFSIFCAFVVLLLGLLSSEVSIIKMLPFLVELEWWTVCVSSEDFSILSCYLLWLGTFIKSGMMSLWTQWWKVGKNSWRCLVQPPAYTLGCLPCDQLCFECLQEGITQPLRATCFRACPPSWSFCFLILCWNFLYSSLSFVLRPSALHIWGSLTLPSLHLPKGGVKQHKISSFLKARVMSLGTLVS